jgi:hypothetical protein
MPDEYYIRRAFAHSKTMDAEPEVQQGGYGNSPTISILPQSIKHNLITSAVLTKAQHGMANADFKFVDGDWVHAPVIDIDHPCTVVPSAKPGHYHLFIDKEMTRVQYFKLLDVMVEVGIVEDGYVAAAKKNGFTGVRIPGDNVKPGLPDTWITRVKEHAKAVWDKFKYEAVLKELANTKPSDPKPYLSKNTLEVLMSFMGPERKAELMEALEITFQEEPTQGENLFLDDLDLLEAAEEPIF